LPVFRARCPDVELAFRLLGVEEQFEMLRAGEIHVGFMRLPASDRTLTVKPLVREPLVIALPERHRLARRRSLALRALSGERFLLFPRTHAPGYYDLLLTCV
jgi:DNA-binding transcriptional LysR family regulator